MEGFAITPLTLRSIAGYDALLNTALLAWIQWLNLVANIIGNLMGHTLRRVWG